MFQLGELGTFSTGPVVYDGHPVRDHAPRHLRDRRDDLQEAVEPSPRRAGPGDERDQQGRRDRRRARDPRHAGRLPLRARREDRCAAVEAAGRRLVASAKGSAPRRSSGTTLVYIAKAGGDWGIRGRMMAFKVEDGSPAWSFDLIPTGKRDRRRHLEDGPAPRSTAAARPGSTYALDRETGTLFVPVGNPGPDYQQGDAPGRQPLHHLGGRARRAHRQAQVVVPAAPQRRSRLGCDRRVAVRLRTAGSCVATAGKEGILHVVDRTTASSCSSCRSPRCSTTTSPLTPEGVRVCPVAGRAMERRGAQSADRPALRQCDRLVHGLQARPGADSGWRPCRTPGSPTAGAPTIRSTSGTAGSTPSIPPPARWPGA